MGLNNARQQKNPRPMVNDSYTRETKRKMSFAFIPFVLGALVLVGSLGQGIEDKTMRLVLLIVGLVLFLIGLIVIVKFAKDLKDHADEVLGTQAQGKEQVVREKITWAEAKNEYKEEAKAAAVAASREMAERIAKAEAKRIAEEEAQKNASDKTE